MVGSIAVTTTVFVTGLALFGVLLWVVEGGVGTFGGLLRLSTRALNRFEIWRFVTYIIPSDSGLFFALLGLVFFFMIGSQFETLVGRRAYTAMIVTLTVVPAVLGVLVALAVGGGVPPFGLSLMFLGLAGGYAAAVPHARSFFGIPFWVVVAAIFVLQILGLLATRSLAGLVMILTSGAIGLIMTRSLGFSTVEWIPELPMPAMATGESGPQDSRPKKQKRSRKSKKGSSHLQAVPNTASEAEIDALLDQVNDQGIDSLSKSQKQTLERHAKEMRKRRDS